MQINRPTSQSYPQRKTILLTFDVEEWFQVENFKDWISYDSWPSRQSRVVESTHRILDLLDDCSSRRNIDSNSNRNDGKIRATFFILGWIAEHHPELVREIHARSHEVASHGYNHELTRVLNRNDLREDIRRSKQLLEDLIGSSVSGYRAPSFSVSEELIDILAELGFKYDSSYNSFGMNKRYGQLNLENRPQDDTTFQLSNDFLELPVSNWQVAGQTLPLGGGGYFRLFPSAIWNVGVRKILREHHTYLMYLHPWEFDPFQPVVTDASPLRKFRHYLNLEKTEIKLDRFINEFLHNRFPTCKEYLANG